MKKLVDYLLDNGEFTNNESALALKIHLTSVSYYEQKAQANKVVKHMIGFKRLLEHQQAEKVISDDAYEILKTDAEIGRASCSERMRIRDRNVTGVQTCALPIFA